MVNGSFGSPSTASDGIHEMEVTDDSIRIVALSQEADLRLSLCPSERADKIGGLGDRGPTGKVLADIDRRAPVDEVLPPQDRDVLAGAEGDHSIRIEGSERGTRHIGVRPADHRQLLRPREIQVERVEGVAESRR